MPNLMDKAIGLLVAAVMVGAVAIPVVGDSLQTEPVTVNNETFNATSDPYLYKVGEASANNFRELDSAQAYNTTAQNTKLTTEVVNETYVNVSGQTSNASKYLQSLNYDYLPTGYINNSAARLVVGFVTIGLALGLFVSSFGLVR